MMKRSEALGLFGAVAGSVFVGGLASAAETIRFAAIPIDGGAQAWYAQSLGYFRDAGITAQIESISNGGAITAGVIGGTIDVGYSNTLSLAAAHEKGVPISIIAAAGSYLARAPISSLMVPVDSPAKTAKDLNGKTVAVNGIKNITQLATEAWSDQNGGDAKSLNFVEMGFPQMPAALAAHRVDAAFLSEPIVTDALRRNLARVIGRPYDAIAPEFTISVWFTTGKWAKANPDLVRRLSSVFRQSSIWANGHDAESAQILSGITKLPLAVVAGVTRSRFAETVSAKGLQPIIDTAARYGFLAKSFPAADLIDPNAVQ
jgi:NitT/TauT family transport system substrate-binding protein